MANTSSRTLRLLSLLQSRRYWPGPVLADRLEVSPRTLRRDVDRLRELGYPVDAHPGVDGGYALAPGAVLPPLVVDDEEAMALAVAVQSQLAQGEIDPERGDASLRALTKIVQVMPRRLRTRLEAVRTATTPAPWTAGSAPARVDHAVLSTLALACRDAERARFAYASADGTPSQRHVEPYRLVPVGSRWYLVAFDLDRTDWRTFRIDRISEATGTGTGATRREPPFDDVAAFVRDRFEGRSRSGIHVEVRIEAPAARVRQQVGRWAEIVEDGDRCVLIMDVESLDWPVYALGAVGAPFTVITPSELGDLVARWGALLTASAGDHGGDHEHDHDGGAARRS